MTTVKSSFLAGAEMMTFLAPPSTCARALVASVKNPVDSITTSAPEIGPLQRRRVALGEGLDRGTIDADLVVGVGDVTREPTQDRVVLQQVREGLVVGEVVDSDDLDVCAGGLHSAEEVAADAAEAVDADAYGHGSSLRASDARTRADPTAIVGVSRPNPIGRSESGSRAVRSPDTADHASDHPVA